MNGNVIRHAMATALLILTPGCGEDDSDSGPGGGGPSVSENCDALSPAALVEFEITGETLRVGVRNDAFVAEAKRLLPSDETRIPVFNTLADGAGCDAQWSWHPDPMDVEFADFTIELCDGVPSYIEENKAEWFSTVGSYCPWSAKVTDVVELE